MNVRIQDIARMANVSMATVSRVVNNNPEGVGPELRAKIQKIIKDTGYRPNLLAKSMVTNKTHMIGFLSPDIAAPFFQNLISGTCDRLEMDGYSLLLCNVSQKQTDYFKTIQNFLDRGIDGILLSGFFSDISQDMTELLADIPVVVFDYIPRKVEMAQINTNNRQASYELVHYLIESGHRKIGCITGPRQYDTVKERLAGYQRALKKFDIEYDPSLVLTGEFTIDSACEPTEQLLNTPDVTAIVCQNDLMAYGAYKICGKLGKRIPDDISIVGFDDIPYSEVLSPPLTTVHQPSYRLGYEGANMLLDQIDKVEDCKRKRILQNKLVIRDSVKTISP